MLGNEMNLATIFIWLQNKKKSLKTIDFKKGLLYNSFRQGEKMNNIFVAQINMMMTMLI